MPKSKIKTKKGAAKRFRVGGSGRIKRARANRRHLLSKKSAKRKLKLSAGVTVDKSDLNRVKQLLVL